MNEAVRCGQCGVRYDGRHKRCPRCRARDPHALAAPAPRAGRLPAAEQRRLGLAAGVGALAVGAALAWFWMAPASSASATAAPSTVPSPLVRFLKGDDRVALKPAPRVPTEVAFLDSPAAARREYREGDYETALQEFRAQIQAHPGHAEPYSNAGQVLVRLGRTAEALPFLQKAVELDPSRWAYRFNLARAEGLMGQWDNAAQDYSEASKLFPGDYATLFNLGQALHRAGREQEAVGRYREAIKQKPDDSSFYLALAVSEDKLGHGPEAAASYRRFLSMDPSARHADAISARAKELETAAAAAPPAQAGAAPGGM
jgi:Flp pilus assembly protein TadD